MFSNQCDSIKVLKQLDSKYNIFSNVYKNPFIKLLYKIIENYKIQNKIIILLWVLIIITLILD